MEDTAFAASVLPWWVCLNYNRAMSARLQAHAASLVLLAFCALALPARAVEWTVAIYAGIDEEEIAQASDPVFEQLSKSDLPAAVQLLIEKDGWGDGGVVRIEKRGKSRATRIDLPEHDSSDPVRFAAFLAWAKSRARGKHTLLIMATHAWGWKGIIQDFTVPGEPGKNRMMPLRVFTETLRQSGLRPEAVVMDACVLGNVDAVHELLPITRYLLVSQRETPFQGLPYDGLFEELARPGMTARRLAREFPERYVREYGRDGRLSKPEGEFDVVTFAGLDLARWGPFAERFRAFTAELARAGLRQQLAENPDWAELFNDDDHNADLLETIRRLPLLLHDESVARLARELDALIGYPDEQSRRTGEALTISPAKGAGFVLRVQRDPYVPETKALEHFEQLWDDANQDLTQPKLQYALEGDWIRIAGETGPAAFAVRPWLPGVKEVRLEYLPAGGDAKAEVFKRERDWVSATRFGPRSFLLGEAHTQGAPFIHGLGILLHPLMQDDEIKSEDRLTGLRGPAAYRALGWNRETGWGELTLLK